MAVHIKVVMYQNVQTCILQVNSTRIGVKVPALVVLVYNTMIYHPKLKSTYFHHCWDAWHHLRIHNFLRGCLQGRCSNDVDTTCASETKIRQADGIPQFFRPWCTNLLVTVGQTTHQRINYFYVDEAISMREHRTPTYQFQFAMVSLTVYSVLFAYYTFLPT